MYLVFAIFGRNWDLTEVLEETAEQQVWRGAVQASGPPVLPPFV